MKISELGNPDKQLITALPVDSDQYDCVEPGNRLDPEREDHSPDQLAILRLKRLAGLTLGTGNKKGKVDSPLTHGGADAGHDMKKYDVEPGTEEWFKLWSNERDAAGNPNVRA
ncbi:hypothetical protein UFOVP71_305 [uncultured Caudovirales phage]|uniref:Uncharacterized protein n=1 Tax=uncultured Caudovirales phage TaxID=2100421 RepID=A0A6J5TCX4_9CAUD|nr:hypothetical protein UFOVP71_305 [uncultured Caudovirales phage]